MRAATSCQEYNEELTGGEASINEYEVEGLQLLDRDGDGGIPARELMLLVVKPDEFGDSHEKMAEDEIFLVYDFAHVRGVVFADEEAWVNSGRR